MCQPTRKTSENPIPETTETVRARRVAAMSPGCEMIEDGALIIARGVVQACGPWRELKSRAPGPVRDLGERTLLPGLINAHTHLELSHVGLPEKTGLGFCAWVRWLLTRPLGALTPQALHSAVRQMRHCATAAVADITSRNALMVSRELQAQGLAHVMQHEFLGWGQDHVLPDLPEELLSLAGHALYSTRPEALKRAKAWDRARGKAFSIHLAEHEGEVEFLATGQGEFAELMHARIVPRDAAPPGLSPVAYAHGLGLLDAQTLAVHAVHVCAHDIGLLAQSGASVCLCPRSNHIIGVGRAPAAAYLAASVPCCLGTDSLASSPDLDLFDELRALLVHTDLTAVDAVRLLATNAARLFGFDRLGTLAPGALARTALLPADLEDALA